MRRETIALHAGFEGDGTTRSVAVPIHQTVSYDFESAEHAAALFNLEAEGYRYSRISNPTNAVLERRVAALEGGVEAMAVASGQAALHCAIANLVEPGRNIISVPQLYGTTHSLFSHHFPSYGVRVLLADSDRPEDVKKLIDKDTRAIFCESVGNPAGNIADIAALAAIAHDHGMPLVVDNTVPTPILCRPFEHGADIVVQSLTKFMGGHGTTLGGIVVDGGTFPWARYPERYPMFSKPDASYHGLVYTERFDNAAYIARCRSVFLRTLGAALAPMSAFLLLQGIETVAIRIERHVENAAKVATFLRDDPRVEWINYAGFESNPYHHFVQTYLGGSACSLLTFGVEGGYAGGMRFYDALKLIKRVVNLGDAKSLACHPASTTHRQMPVKDQLKAGVTPSTIRLSIGIEHIDDILADLDQAIAGSDKTTPRSRVPFGADERALEGLSMNGTNLDHTSLHHCASQHALKIGLVNNMPPSACAATERQFSQLLAAAGSDEDVGLHCYRTDIRNAASARVDISALFETELDGLIVTGAEPQASSLREEPVWPLITRLVDWAEARAIPTMWSCLAAHAAVLYLDGVDRVLLDRKISGLFKGEVVASDHPLMAGVAGGWTVPHSRCNDLLEETLTANGYRVLVRSPGAGVDLFQNASNPNFLFLQSHPEYEADTLRREFHRDVKRFHLGERPNPPTLPRSYFASIAESLWCRLAVGRVSVARMPRRSLHGSAGAASNLCRRRGGRQR